MNPAEVMQNPGQSLWPVIEPPQAQRSALLNELAAALAKAQAKIQTAAKDAVNPHFESRYADLASVWSACREALTEQGLAIVQMPCGEGDRVGLTTTLLHASGQWMASTIYATPERKGPQAVGSVLTYLRRYALAAAVGVAPDDDDAEAASVRPSAPGAANDNGRRVATTSRLAPRRSADPPPAPDGEPVPSPPGPSLGALRRYHALRDELGISEDEGRERVGKVVGRKIESITALSGAEMDRIIAKMEGTAGGAAS